MDHLRYVFDAVALIRRELDGAVPLIGFSGSPWTLACYMVEGQGSSDYRQIKTLLYQRPDLLHRILSINAQAVQAYLNAQIQAGAQAVMVFDSWGGVLADGLFQQFSLAYTRQVLEGLVREHDGRRVPVIVFTKGGGQWIKDVAATGCDAVGLDWTANLAAGTAPGSATGSPLQGNLDPMTLFGGEAAIRTEVTAGPGRLRHGRIRGPRLQSGAWDFTVHAAGGCFGSGGRGSRRQPRVSWGMNRVGVRRNPGETGCLKSKAPVDADSEVLCLCTKKSEIRVYAHHCRQILVMFRKPLFLIYKSVFVANATKTDHLGGLVLTPLRCDSPQSYPQAECDRAAAERSCR